MPDEISTTDATEQAEVSRQYLVAEIQRGKIKARKVNPEAANSPYQIERKSFAAWLAERLKKKNKRLRARNPKPAWVRQGRSRPRPACLRKKSPNAAL